MSVKARMTVLFVEDSTAGREVAMSAVYSADPNSPNYSFSTATPAACLSMLITNPDAFEQFGMGQTFDLLFTPHVEDSEVNHA